jgi:cob(I)alamin adenosyltransferase
MTVPRIYTRTGDDGDTGLVDGSRTSKADPRVDLYGDVDELNSAIGLALASDSTAARGDALRGALESIQIDLFELGALLADPGRCERLATGQSDDHAVRGESLEPVIDALDAPLPPLRAFILPGGEPMAAALHLARTICRRTERKAVSLRGAGTAVPESVLIYLNRLSDLLFVAARRANFAAGREDVLWSGRRTDP